MITWRDYTDAPERYDADPAQREVDTASVWTMSMDVVDAYRVGDVMAAVQVHPALTGDYQVGLRRLTIFARAHDARAALALAASLSALIAPLVQCKWIEVHAAGSRRAHAGDVSVPHPRGTTHV